MSTHMIDGVLVIFPDYAPTHYKKYGLVSARTTITNLRHRGTIDEVSCLFVDFPYHSPDTPRIIGVRHPEMPRQYFKWRDGLRDGRWRWP